MRVRYDYYYFPSKFWAMIYCCKVYHEIIFQQIFDRSITWEDPTKWVILRYPWNKDHSRFLHTLRKLRQVDVVLNRNHLGSDNGEMILLFLFNGFEHFQLKGVMGDSYSVGIDKINSTVGQSKFTHDSITVLLNIGG